MINFSDTALNGNYLAGEKLYIGEVLNKDIVLLDFEFGESRYGGNRTTIQFYFFDDVAKTKHVILTSSTVLEKQSRELKTKYIDVDDRQEIKTKIIQEDSNKCYKFV